MASARRSGTNENISTYGNGTRDYTSLSTWESATDNDLVTSTTSEVLECYADSASFSDSIIFAGAITDSSYFRIIRPASGEGHTGIPGSGIVFTSTSAGSVLDLNEDYVSVQDLNAVVSRNSGGGNMAIQIRGLNCVVVGCLVKGTNPGAGGGDGINFVSGSGGSVAVNCLAYECKDEGIQTSTAVASYWYNCTAVGCDVGFLVNNQSRQKNCLASGNVTSDYSGTTHAESEANASSDATAVGTSPRINQTFTFVDAAGDDYHLSAADTGALGFGTDLSADTNFAFDDDIDSVTITTWSIGADSDPAAASTAAATSAALLMRRRRR